MPDLISLWRFGLRLGTLWLRGVLQEPGITAQATAEFLLWWPSAFLIDLKHYGSSCTTQQQNITALSKELKWVMAEEPVLGSCWSTAQGCVWESWF